MAPRGGRTSHMSHTRLRAANKRSVHDDDVAVRRFVVSSRRSRRHTMSCRHFAAVRTATRDASAFKHLIHNSISLSSIQGLRELLACCIDPYKIRQIKRHVDFVDEEKPSQFKKIKIASYKIVKIEETSLNFIKRNHFAKAGYRLKCIIKRKERTES